MSEIDILLGHLHELSLDASSQLAPASTVAPIGSDQPLSDDAVGGIEALDSDVSGISTTAGAAGTALSPCGKSTMRKCSDWQVVAMSTPTSKGSGSRPVTSTPTSKSRRYCNDCDDAMCAVCLSPLHQKTASASRIVVVTRCKHQFHNHCLIGTKQRKAECPYCRTALTPLTTTQQMEGTRSPSDRPPPRLAFMHPGTATMQRHIVQAASRAREAVRLAAVRREHEQRRALRNSESSLEEAVCAGV